MSKKEQKPVRNKKQEKEQKVAEQIQVILLKNNMALQPFLDFSAFGVVPRVRLVDTSKQDNVEQDTNTGEAGGTEDADGATQPE